jgi:hypothetical protein
VHLGLTDWALGAAFADPSSVRHNGGVPLENAFLAEEVVTPRLDRVGRRREIFATEMTGEGKLFALRIVSNEILALLISNSTT